MINQTLRRYGLPEAPCQQAQEQRILAIKQRYYLATKRQLAHSDAREVDVMAIRLAQAVPHIDYDTWVKFAVETKKLVNDQLDNAERVADELIRLQTSETLRALELDRLPLASQVRKLIQLRQRVESCVLGCMGRVISIEDNGRVHVKIAGRKLRAVTDFTTWPDALKLRYMGEYWAVFNDLKPGDWGL